MAPRSKFLHERSKIRPATQEMWKNWANHKYAALLGPYPSTKPAELDKTHEERVDAHAKAVEAEFAKNDKPAYTGLKMVGPGHEDTEKVPQYVDGIMPLAPVIAVPRDGDLCELKTFRTTVPFGYPVLPARLTNGHVMNAGPVPALQPKKAAVKKTAAKKTAAVDPEDGNAT